jgi:hypothetical protein
MCPPERSVSDYVPVRSDSNVPTEAAIIGRNRLGR